MAKRLQLRGGTAAQNDAFTGAAREITVDTTNWALRLHDGVTTGGRSLSGRVQPPLSSKGAPADKAGTWSADSAYYYYCAIDYTTGTADIWRRVAFTGGTW